MAVARKVTATKGPAHMDPGTLLQEGVVVSHDEHGVLVGRLAEPGESCPAGHTEHRYGSRVVFLARGQAPIPPAGLHKRKATKGDTA